MYVPPFSTDEFRPYSRVSHINLNGNLIRTVGNHAFRFCPKLQQVTLSNNRIKTIGPYAFAGKNNEQLNQMGNLNNFLTGIGNDFHLKILCHN